MSVVALPADRRFRRSRVKPARRRGWWRAAAPLLRVAATAAGVGYGALLAVTTALDAQALSIDRIVVQGNRQLSTGEVHRALAGLRGQNLLTTDLGAWRERLLASPWIVDAALRRTLPSTIDVVLVEREPVAAGRLNGDLYLIDPLGKVIDRYGPRYAALDLPIVDGLSTPTGIDGARAALAARLLSSIKPVPDVAHRVSQVDVTDVHNAAVILSGDPALVYVGEDRFLERLRSYIELSSALRDRVPQIDYVDLRFDDRMYVGPSRARPVARDRPSSPAATRQPVEARKSKRAGR
jgi:cell division protein FtsQ